MRSLSLRVRAGVYYACLLFAVVAIAIGAVGILGVTSATRTANSIASDELTTATATAQLAHEVDVAYSTGVGLLLSPDPAERSRLATTLYDQAVPAVESGLANIEQIHADD